MPRKTIARPVSATGAALHAGLPATMSLEPAAPCAGIVFRRSDLGRDIPARYDLVADTRLGTVLAKDGATVGVVEHLMAALAGEGIDDVLVVLDGPEPPILDGDSLSYLRLIEEAGIVEAHAPGKAIRVLKMVSVAQGDARAALHPSATRRFDFEITFDSPAIGTQRFSFELTPERFRREIAPARTFGFMKDLDALLKAGLGRGATLQNTLAIEGDRVVNRERMRFPDEFVRHKILDAVGDLALAGSPILGRFEGVRSGHALNNALLHALFADPSNYETVPSP
jgi:UDP-3-O-[3-hydroxymyristoyl] N-acetylglucosamine deacetylase